MRAMFASLALMCAALLLVSGSQAGDKDKDKEVVLKGKICCAKCELSIGTECQTVIVVKGKDKKDVTYYFDKAGHGKYHCDICSSPKNGSVTGIVKDADKKKTITVKKVEYDK
jgi:hypothetical protein